MPPVIIAAGMGALGGFVGGAGLFGFAAGTLAATLAMGGVGLVLGGLQYALTPKPKKSNFSNNSVNSSTVSIRQAASTHKHIYGMTRYTDCYAQIVSTGVNEKIHAVVIICADEAASIDEVWLDDYPISPDDMDADGNVISGRYAGFLRIRKNLGSPEQLADPVAVTEIPEWTDTCRLQGICYLYVTFTKSQDIYPNGLPNVSVIGRFRKIYDPRLGRARWTPNVALFGYDFLNRADYGFQCLDDDINLTNISAQASICDEIVDTVDVDMVVASIATGTDIITLTGTVLVFETADRVEIIAGEPGSEPGGLDLLTDYYVIPYQIGKTPRIKLAATLDDAIDGIAIDITSAGTGTITVRKNGEPRYHGAGVIDTADNLQDGMNAILSGMAGRACFTGGLWRLLAGAWQEPTLDLGIGDMRAGGVGTRSKISMAERYNTISGLHISQINSYQQADYPPYRNQDYIDYDLQEHPKDYPLPFTSRPTTAKRIVKLEVIKSRLEKIFTASFSMKGFTAQAGDNVSLTYEKRGWEDKPFELTNFGFAISGAEEGNQQLLTNMTLRETDESIYAWAASEDDPPLVIAPNTNLPNPFDVPVVTGVAYSSRAAGTAGGDTLFTLVLNWDPHPDSLVVEYGQFEIQFKESSEVDWRPSFNVSGHQVSSDVIASSVNVAYDLRIRAINKLGVRSNWDTLLGAVIGTSGGVGTTNNWGNWTDSIGASLDYGNWTDAVGTTDDWEFFT